MNRLYLGIEINNDTCNIACYDHYADNNRKIKNISDDKGIPILLSYDSNLDKWSSGIEAEKNIGKKGHLVLGKLFKLFMLNNIIKIGDKEFSVDYLMELYLKYIIDYVYEKTKGNHIEDITFCIEDMPVKDKERIYILSKRINKSLNIHIINQREAYIYFLMKQSKENWINMSYMFDYTIDGFFSYEIKTIKKGKKLIVLCDREKINGAPLVEIVGSKGEKAKAADRILAKKINNLFTGKIISSVYLCGQGFKTLDWAIEIKKSLALQRSRKIYQVNNLYSVGAAYAAYELVNNRETFLYLCEGRVNASVSILVDNEKSKEEVVLIKNGTNIMEARTEIELMLIDQDYVDLLIKRINKYEPEIFKVSLSKYFEDYRNRTKVVLSVAFIEDDELFIHIKDLGFGDIFPTTDIEIKQKFNLKINE